MNRQILRNIFFNGLSFITNMGIMLLLTPYLVKHLGLIAYGFIPLAAIFTAYIGIITESLTISINRSLTESLQKGNKQEVKEIFSTALTSMLAIIAIISVLMAIPILYLSDIITIPAELTYQVTALFVLLISTFLLSLLTAVFSVAMYANNRIDLMQTNSVVRNIVRAVAIFILFSYDDITLMSVGYATLLSGIASFVFAYYYKMKLSPEMLWEIRSFKKDKAKSITHMGGWLLVNQIGFVLFLKVDLLLINRFLGAEQSALYSIVLQITDVLRIFAGIISGVLGPVLLILYSQSKHQEMISMTKGFIKFLSLSISIPIVVICIWSKEIMHFWIGEQYEILSPLIWILVLPLAINIGVQPLFSVQVAMNKVKIPALFNITLGMLGIISAVLLLEFTNLNYYAVAIAGVVTLTLKNSILIPIYTSSILKISSFEFLYVHIRTICFSFLSILLSLVVKNYFIPHNLFYFLTILCLSCLALFIISIAFYSKDDRKKFTQFIAEKI